MVTNDFNKEGKQALVAFLLSDEATYLTIAYHLVDVAYAVQ